MRKLKLLCLCGLTAAVLMTGCAGSTDTTNVNLGSATVSEYRGVKINVAAPEVTDDEVDQKIQTNLKQNPNEVEVDRAAKDGDIVKIEVCGPRGGIFNNVAIRVTESSALECHIDTEEANAMNVGSADKVSIIK